MQIPDGYRLLKDGEQIQAGDMYWTAKLLDGSDLELATPGPVYDQQQFVPIFRKEKK